LVLLFMLSIGLWRMCRGVAHPSARRVLGWFVPLGSKFHKSAWIRTFFAFYLFSYNTMSEAALEYYHCVQLRDGLSVMGSIPALVCGSAEYASIGGVFIALIAVWLTALPFFTLSFLAFLYRAKTLAVPKNIIRYGALYEVYRGNCWWWEGFVLVRRLVLVWISVVVYENRYERAAWLSFANILFLMAHMVFRPYENPISNRNETAALAILTVISTLLPSLHTPMSLGESIGMGLLVFPPAFTLCVLIGIERSSLVARFSRTASSKPAHGSHGSASSSSSLDLPSSSDAQSDISLATLPVPTV